MRVMLLEAIHYPPDGADWRSIETPDPDWPAIEAAIRRLDRDEWPFLWLHTVPAVEGEMPEIAVLCSWCSVPRTPYLTASRNSPTAGEHQERSRSANHIFLYQ